MNHKANVLHSLRWMTGAKLAGQILNWLITIIVVRLLTPDDYGLIAMAAAFVAFLSMISELGLGTALVQAKSIDDKSIAQVFGATVLLNILLFLILLFAAPSVAHFFSDERLTAIIRVSGVGFLLNIALVVPDALLRRQMSFKTLALIEVFCSVAGNFVTFILALSGFEVWSLVYGTLFSTAARMIWTFAVSPKRVWPSFSFGSSYGLMKFGSTITLSRILWYFMSQADVLAAGRLLGREAVGHYSLAMNLASIPMERVMAIINPVAFPAIARIQQDKSAVSRAISTSIAILSFLAFPVFWGISSVSQELVSVLLGPRWLDSAIALQIVTLVMPIRMVSSLLSVATSAIGRPDIELQVTLIGAFVMPISFVIGCQFGLVGLSFGWVIGVPLVFIASVGSRLAVLGIKSRMLVSRAGPAIVASAFMYVIVLITRESLCHLFNTAALLFFMIGSGVITYVGIALSVNRRSLEEVLDAIRNRSDSGEGGAAQ